MRTYLMSCTVSKLWLIIGRIFSNETEFLSLSLSLGVTPANIAINDISLTRNSSGDEIANVNFRNDDIVHALQNTIDSCMNSATDRRGYVLEHSLHRFTKFNEITQCNGNYAVQGHSRSPMLVPIKSLYTTSY